MFGQLFTFAGVPNVISVRFMDESHMKAEVAIRTWSSGGTLLMDKQQGEWCVVHVGTAYVN
jgi:hydrogenase maturation factor